MTLSPEMRQKLADRLAALDARVPVSLVGPDLRCETVEDAERLVARFETWLDVFAALAHDADTVREDRSSLTRLYDTFSKLVADLEAAIQATRERGIPWEQTRDTVATEEKPLASNPHPMQPVIKDRHGTLRFRENAIVRLLVDDLAGLVVPDGPRRGKLDLDKIATMDVPPEDRAQFEQLAGMRSGGRENAIVCYVVAHARQLVSRNPVHAGCLDLNALVMMKFPQEDREQFAQLMGYSICGYHELSYVSDDSAAEASLAAKKVMPEAGGCRDKGCFHGGPLFDENGKRLS